MKFLIWAVLAVLVTSIKRHGWCRRRPQYVARHSTEEVLDRLWSTGLAELAARRRAMGWA